MATKKKSGSPSAAGKVRRQREIQRQTDRNDAAAGKSRQHGKAIQRVPLAGAQDHPQNPPPKQLLHKPSLESGPAPRPQFPAPDDAGSGQPAFITGGDSGIGRSAAVLFAREGADVAIIDLSEDSDAQEIGDYVEADGPRGRRKLRPPMCGGLRHAAPATSPARFCR